MRSGRLPKSPAFQVYAPDALSDAALTALPPAAYGFFWKLLLFAWINAGLADDLVATAALCGVSATEHEADLTAALQLFPVGKGGRRFNARQERERSFQAEGRAKRLAASKLALDARYESHANRSPTVVPIASPPYPVARSPSPEARAKKKRAAPSAQLGFAVIFADRPKLDTPAIRTALTGYVEYRRERKLSTLLDSSWKTSAVDFEAWGEAGLLQSVHDTIAKGWQGLFPPKLNGEHKPALPQAAPYHKPWKRPEWMDEKPKAVAE